MMLKVKRVQTDSINILIDVLILVVVHFFYLKERKGNKTKKKSLTSEDMNLFP